MKVQTTTWTPEDGWHAPLPEPDGCSTMALVVGESVLATHPARPLDHIAGAWAGHPVIGCSTAGHSLDEAAHGTALTLVSVTFDDTELRHSAVEIRPAGGTRRACRQLATKLSTPGLRGLIVFADAQANSSDIARGFDDVASGVPLFGGIASDAGRAASTWTLVDGQAVTGWVSAIGFAGEHVRLGFGTASGWEPFGAEHLVTESHANLVYRIDDAPVTAMWQRCGVPDPDALRAAALAHPIAVRDLDGNVVVRSVVGVDARAGALRFAADIAQGSTMQFVRGSGTAFVDSARQAARAASVGGEQFAVAMSGCARRGVLHRRDETLTAAREALAPGVRLVGLDTDGEFTPGTLRDVHNQSISIATIAETPQVP